MMIVELSMSLKMSVVYDVTAISNELQRRFYQVVHKQHIYVGFVVIEILLK